MAEIKFTLTDIDEPETQQLVDLIIKLLLETPEPSLADNAPAVCEALRKYNEQEDSSPDAGFGMIIMEMVEQIPYNHPAMRRLTTLLRMMKSKAEQSKDKNLRASVLNSLDWLHSLLEREFLPPQYGGEDNYHAKNLSLTTFYARLYKNGFTFLPDFPAHSMSCAFEESNLATLSPVTAVVITAPWILLTGQLFFRNMVKPLKDGRQTYQGMAPGKRYVEIVPEEERLEIPSFIVDKSPRVRTFSIRRWRFWKDELARARDHKDLDEEYKKLANRAFELMDVIERTYF